MMRTRSKSKRNAAIATLLVTIGILACILAGRAFVRETLRPSDQVGECSDRDGDHPLQSDPAAYYRCIDARAKVFLAGDYAESKDLGKAFLTLLTAVFVASITFSEKIVNVKEASWWPRGVMIAAWSLLLVAIAACGCGLCFITLAAGQATYRPDLNFYELEWRSVVMFITSGLTFGSALVFLLVAGILSMLDGHAGIEVTPRDTNAKTSAG
jgi:hypothetical protein